MEIKETTDEKLNKDKKDKIWKYKYIFSVRYIVKK